MNRTWHPASVLALLSIMAGCSTSDDEPNAGGNGAPASEDGSEVQSTVVKPRSLELLSQKDVTPAGKQAHRPDVTNVGGELWLAYGVSGEGLYLQRFDTDLNELGSPVALAVASEPTTDVRVGISGSHFWYAYESVAFTGESCDNHFLNAAGYSASVPPALAANATHLALGCSGEKTFKESPSGLPAHPEYTDDPTPFSHDAARYVLTRAWDGSGGTPVHHLRRLDEQLQISEDILLDTSALVPGRHLTQNSLLHIEGKPYLVSGFQNGMYVSPFTSQLYALELADDLGSFSGAAIPLDTQGVAFADRVTRARHVNGSLIINFVDRYVGQPVREYVAFYDVQNGFALLGRTQTQDHEVMDNHSSFEVIGDHLYLFQQQDGEKLSAKSYLLRP